MKRDLRIYADKLCRSIVGPGRVYMYSWGGNGTRMLYEFIKQKHLINRQEDVHYHIQRWLPEKDIPIAIIGNPIDSIKSFYRKQEKDDPTFIKRHCANLGIPYFRIDTFVDYSRTGKDLFELENYWDRLISTPRKYDMLFVKFESLWDHLDAVLQHVGMEDMIDSFPRKRERTNNINDVLSPHDIERLTNTYGSLMRKYDEFPSLRLM